MATKSQRMASTSRAVVSSSPSRGGRIAYAAPRITYVPGTVSQIDFAKNFWRAVLSPTECPAISGRSVLIDTSFVFRSGYAPWHGWPAGRVGERSQVAARANGNIELTRPGGR